MKKKYVLVYPNRKLLAIDQSSGYPYEVEDGPRIWTNKKEVQDYAKHFPNERLELFELEYTLKEEGITQEIEVFVDATDFYHEIGAGNAPGPHYIYNSAAEIQHKQPCAIQCGVVRAKLVKLETVVKGNWRAKTHDISLSEKYLKAITALREIVESNVPGGGERVFDIAQECLDELKITRGKDD